MAEKAVVPSSRYQRKAPSRGSKPGERRGGRKPGTRNIITRELKDMILAALDQAGGVDYLHQQAVAQPGAFLSLVGRVLPMTVAGPSGGLMTPRRVIIELEDGSC